MCVVFAVVLFFLLNLVQTLVLKKKKQFFLLNISMEKWFLIALNSSRFYGCSFFIFISSWYWLKTFYDWINVLERVLCIRGGYENNLCLNSIPERTAIVVWHFAVGYLWRFCCDLKVFLLWFVFFLLTFCLNGKYRLPVDYYSMFLGVCLSLFLFIHFNFVWFSHDFTIHTVNWSWLENAIQ